MLSFKMYFPEVLENVPLSLWVGMHFQHDGVAAHFIYNVWDFLTMQFSRRWSGRGGPIAWPPRSPDLTCLDFFLWSYLKSLVYEIVESEQDLIACTPGIFERIGQSLHSRFLPPPESLLIAGISSSYCKLITECKAMLINELINH